MKGRGPKISPEAMKKLMLIGEKQGCVPLADLANEIGLSEDDTLALLKDVFPDGQGIEIRHHQDQLVVDIDGSALQYMLPLSPSEWLGLHQVLSDMNVSTMMKNPALDSLKKKVIENSPIKAVMELLNHLEAWDLQLNDEQQDFVSILDKAVLQKSVVNLKTIHEKVYQAFPSRIIHLEGRLSMIAEDVNDHCLLVVPVNELVALSNVETTSHPRVSSFEIEEFIFAIRAMSEKETRLILKIHDPQFLNLFPDHQFLGKPCMVTNPNGDLIWAAYVEPCEDLFEWLISLKSNVEILDPIKFKEEYLTYCEEKLRKVA
jgi:hypothetical protein